MSPRHFRLASTRACLCTRHDAPVATHVGAPVGCPVTVHARSARATGPRRRITSTAALPLQLEPRSSPYTGARWSCLRCSRGLAVARGRRNDCFGWQAPGRSHLVGVDIQRTAATAALRCDVQLALAARGGGGGVAYPDSPYIAHFPRLPFGRSVCRGSPLPAACRWRTSPPGWPPLSHFRSCPRPVM